MLETIAQLQRTNMQLQRQQKDMERCARVQEFEKVREGCDAEPVYLRRNPIELICGFF